MHNYLKDIKLLVSGNELREIYWSNAIRLFAFGLIGIFIPIMFLELGHSLEQVAEYLVWIYATMIAFSFGVSYLQEKIGLKKTIVVGSVITTLFFVMAGLFAEFVYLLPLFGFIFGVGRTLYWVPLKADFSLQVDEDKTGTYYGVWSMIATLTSVISPLIGGLLLTYLGFNLVLFVGVILMMASTIPLMLTIDYPVIPKKSLSCLFMGDLKEVFFEFVVEGLILGVHILWPIYIYTLNPSYFVVGLLSMFAGIAVAFFQYFYGVLSDKYSKLTLLKVGGVTIIVTFLIAYFIQNFYFIAGISFVLGFAMAMVKTPLESFFAGYAKEDPIKWMTVREIGLCAGRMIILLLFLSTLSFRLTFLATALGSIFLLTVKPLNLKRYPQLP